MKNIKTNRLCIVPYTLAQFTELILSQQPDDYLAPEALVPKDGQEAEPTETYPMEYSKYTYWHIYLRADNICIGNLRTDRHPDNGITTLRFVIDPAYQNKGYASEAVGATVEWASSSNVCFIIAEITDENPVAVSVLKRNKFKRFGVAADGRLWVRKTPYPLRSIALSFNVLFSLFLVLVMLIGLFIRSLLGVADIPLHRLFISCVYPVGLVITIFARNFAMRWNSKKELNRSVYTKP